MARGVFYDFHINTVMDIFYDKWTLFVCNGLRIFKINYSTTVYLKIALTMVLLFDVQNKLG